MQTYTDKIFDFFDTADKIPVYLSGIDCNPFLREVLPLDDSKTLYSYGNNIYSTGLEEEFESGQRSLNFYKINMDNIAVQIGIHDFRGNIEERGLQRDNTISHDFIIDISFYSFFTKRDGTKKYYRFLLFCYNNTKENDIELSVEVSDGKKFIEVWQENKYSEDVLTKHELKFLKFPYNKTIFERDVTDILLCDKNDIMEHIGVFMREYHPILPYNFPIEGLPEDLEGIIVPEYLKIDGISFLDVPVENV